MKAQLRPEAMTLALSLALSAPSLSAANPSQATAESLAPVHIGIELIKHLPTTSVMVDGVHHHLFLDLAGAAALALTPEELSNTPVDFLHQVKEVRNAMNEASESRRFTAKSVRLGDSEVGPLIGDEWNIGNYGPPDRNGYLGMGFFAQHLVVLDYGSSKVSLYPGGDLSRLASECPNSRQFDVKLENGIAVSKITTDIGVLRVLWDTGSTDNVVRARLLEDNGRRGVPSDDGPPTFSFKRFVGLSERSAEPNFRVIAFRAPEVDLVLGTPYFAANKVCLDLAAGRGAVAPYKP